MLDKLQAVAHRYEEINSQLYQAEVASQPELYNALLKEASQLQPIADAYARLCNQKHRLAEAQELLTDSGDDKELKTLAQSELSEAKSPSKNSLRNSKSSFSPAILTTIVTLS